MFREHTAAHAAAYLLFRAGAEGMSRRRLLALMYLAEREAVRTRRVPPTRGSWMLTEDGPVVREVYECVMGDFGAGADWLRGIELVSDEGASGVVSDGAVGYAERSVDAAAGERLVLCSPYPAYVERDGSVMEPLVDSWEGKEEGMPYLGGLSDSNHRCLQAVWESHGGLGEAELLREMRGLPECGGATSGEVTLRAVAEAVGLSPREIEMAEGVKRELEKLDRAHQLHLLRAAELLQP